MKTTNKEHIIKEKLQGVDLPDMDTSWQKMEQSLDAGIAAQTGWSAFLAKYKLYLNIFIAAVVISAVGLYVKSTTKQFINDANELVSNNTTHVSQTNYLTLDMHIDHDNDLPVPSLPAMPVSAAPARAIHPPRIVNDTLPASTEKTEDNNLPPTEVVVHYLDTMPEIVRIVDGDDLRRHRVPEVQYVRNQVGLKLQVGVLPNVNGQGIVQTAGVGLFARRFITDRTAVQLEIGYNPIAIRPMTYVERYNVFNNFNYTQTDSAQVTGLKYVTIPLNVYYQLTPELSINIGPQISFLTGLSGDITRKFQYPTAPESALTTENSAIDNRGGFNKTDIGLNAELDWRIRNRFIVGFRVQQGLSDYSHETLSPRKHVFNTIQFKASWTLN